MIQKNSKSYDGLAAEMQAVMQSAEHKKMFQPLVIKTAQDYTFPELKVTPDTSVKDSLVSILSKVEATVAPELQLSLKKVVDALKGLAEGVTEQELNETLEAAKMALKPSQAAELAKLLGLDPEKAKAAVSTQEHLAPTEKVQPSLGTFDQAVKEMPTAELPATAAIVDVVVKLGNYFGEHKFAKSEIVADMLLEALLSEIK
jgi:hypothetical protein